MTRTISTLLGIIAIVPYEDKFLLIEEAKPSVYGKWSLPGGVVEIGEDLAQAVQREVMEESGITVKPRGILAMEHKVCDMTTEQPYSLKMLFIVVADPLSLETKSAPDQESLSARFYTLKEINGLALRDQRYSEWIKAYLQNKPLLSIY